MKIELELTKEEEAFIIETAKHLGVDLNDYVKELLLDDFSLLMEEDNEMMEMFADVESEEDLKNVLIEQVQIMNPLLSDEEAKQMVEELIQEEGTPMPFFMDSDDEDDSDNIIPFNKDK